MGNNGLLAEVADLPSEIPAWGWVGLAVGSLIMLVWGLTQVSPKLLSIWLEWRTKLDERRLKIRQEELAHRKQEMELKHQETEPLRQEIKELKCDLELIRQKAQETEEAHKRDLLKALENTIACREECAKCLAELATLKAAHGIS